MATAGGFEGKIKVGTDVATMRSSSAINWTSFDVNTKNNIKRIFTGGFRTTQELKEMLQEIGSKIARDFEGKTVLADRTVFTGAVTTYVIGIYPNGYVSGYLEIQLSGKFDTWKMTMKMDDVAKEESDFIPSSITFSTVPA